MQDNAAEVLAGRSSGAARRHGEPCPLQREVADARDFGGLRRGEVPPVPPGSVGLGYFKVDDHVGQRRYIIALATKDLAAGEEVQADYGQDYWRQIWVHMKKERPLLNRNQEIRRMQEEYKAELKKLSKENARLQQQTSAGPRLLAQTIDQLSAVNEQLMQEAKEQRRCSQEQQQQLAAAQQQLAAAQQQLTKEQQRVAAAQQSAERRRRRADGLKREAAAAKQKAKERRQQVKELQLKLAAAEQGADAARKAAAQVKQQLADTQSQLRTAQREAKVAAAQAKGLRARLAALQQRRGVVELDGSDSTEAVAARVSEYKWRATLLPAGHATFVAVKEGDAAALRTLLAEDAAGVLGAQVRDGSSVLHAAARRRSAALVEVLLSAGADASARDAGGCTPLHLAAGAGHLAAVRALLAARGGQQQLRAVSRRGNTPLHLAALGDRVGVAEALVDAGAPLHVLNRRLQTPRQAAKSKGHSAVAWLLEMSAAVRPAKRARRE